MRLINTSTLVLHEFIDAEDAPTYAILSHCWDEDEISFKAFNKKRNHDSAGYRKIVNCCKFALGRGRRWVWIDTCCIDKRSSAGLNEAINSMFEWYQAAVECYAYLGDVTAAPSNTIVLLEQFDDSRWFTRGWTLQELIAPANVIFVTADWTIIGSKSVTNTVTEVGHLRLTSQIERVTGIPASILCDEKGLLLDDFSAAQRLSWMADRNTSHLEDQAYCLLGLLGINIPLIYGEGSKAFMRLQTEILNQNEDESIFAWHPGRDRLPQHDMLAAYGVLAHSPSYFANASTVERSIGVHNRPPCSMTGRGIEFRIPRDPDHCGAYLHRSVKPPLYLLRLNCARPYLTQRCFWPCNLLLQREPCGHFVRIFGRDIEHEAYMENPDDWVQIPYADTFYVHPSDKHNLHCRDSSLRKFCFARKSFLPTRGRSPL